MATTNTDKIAFTHGYTPPMRDHNWSVSSGVSLQPDSKFWVWLLHHGNLSTENGSTWMEGLYWGCDFVLYYGTSLLFTFFITVFV